jgi:membrane protein DedA with SNARE-associated domain
MTPERRKIWLPLAILGCALVIWAGMLALGAYLQPGADQPKHDWRRAMIVAGSMAAFLGVWGLALWMRFRRSQ